MPEVAADHDVGGGVAERVAQDPGDALRDRPVVDPVDLEHLVAVGDEPLLPGGGARPVDDGPAVDARRIEFPQGEGLELVLAEDRGEGDGRAGRLDVPRHAAGAAREEVRALESDAEGRRLRRAAEEGAVAVDVDDRVAEDVHPQPRQPTQNLAEVREVDALGLHEREELLE